MRSDAAPRHLDVVLPVYRNAATVEELARRLHRALELESTSHQLIFVDDGCPEDSFDVLRRMAAREPRVTAVRLARNVGQHAAVMVGLTYSRGDWTVIMDADLQDPPEAIAGLLEAAGPSTAAVFAGRRGAYQSWGRLLTSRVFKTLLHWVTGVPRDAGIFVALRRETVSRLLELRTSRPFVVTMIGSLGLEMKSVPVERSPRPEGSSAYSSLARMRSAWRGFACFRDCRRQGRRQSRQQKMGRQSLWSRPNRIVSACLGRDPLEEDRLEGPTTAPDDPG